MGTHCRAGCGRLQGKVDVVFAVFEGEGGFFPFFAVGVFLQGYVDFLLYLSGKFVFFLLEVVSTIYPMSISRLVCSICIHFKYRLVCM